MLDDAVIRKYIPQWRTALKPGGKMFMTDHNPEDGGHTGPRRPIKCVLWLPALLCTLSAGTTVNTVGRHYWVRC